MQKNRKNPGRDDIIISPLRGLGCFDNRFSIIISPFQGYENPERDDIIIEITCKKTGKNPERDDIIILLLRGLGCFDNRFSIIISPFQGYENPESDDIIIELLFRNTDHFEYIP